MQAQRCLLLNSITTVQVSDTTMLNSSPIAGIKKNYFL